MQLLRLKAQNFKLLSDVELGFHPKLNIITGDNAAGKTTLLDAISTVAHGQPPGGLYEQACGATGKNWRLKITGEDTPGWPATTAEIIFRNKRHQQQIDNTVCTRAELARLIPLAYLNPGTHALVADGPSQRRRFLDWGMFHVEHAFIHQWRRYRRALKQRNAILRTSDDMRLLEPWDSEMADSGEWLHAVRNKYINAISTAVIDNLQQLVGQADWSITLYSGWKADLSLRAALLANRDAERRAGVSLSGPHRAELLIRRNGAQARRRVSRGEEKLMAAALLLAQSRHIQDYTQRRVVFLVDDFTSELGAAAQARLFNCLERSDLQVFITSLSASPVLSGAKDRHMFHVEHGQVGRVLK